MKTLTILLLAPLLTFAALPVWSQVTPGFEKSLGISLAQIRRLPSPAPVEGVELEAPAGHLWQQQSPPAPGGQYRVECDLHGQHGRDVDRMDAAREIELLRAAVAEAVPNLPSELQEVAGQVVFRVAHNPSVRSKTFSGWGPEDDPDYRYPDRAFFPEGTIKVNFTEKFMRALDLGERLGRGNPLAANGVRGYARMTITHELLHAWQYHTAPVRDLQRSTGSVVDGLADEDILAENERKIQYERDAFALHRPIVREHQAGILALAAAIRAHAAAFPALFAQDGGEFRILTQGASPFVDHYLADEVALAIRPQPLGDAFSDTARAYYEGQYRTGRIVNELVRINGGQDPPLPEFGTTRAEAARVDALALEWRQYMTGPGGDILRRTRPYTAAIENRYKSEMETFRSRNILD